MTILKPSTPRRREFRENNNEKAQGVQGHNSFALLCLATLGVVYGDLGTNPLFAFRECLYGITHLPATAANVLGLLSLIFWALLIVIALKYITFMLRADNDGEGGVLALLALLRPWRETSFLSRKILITLALFGAGLLYGDGIITPAISVLSAIEGLEVATPALRPYVVPLTVLVLVLLFLFQKKGTERIGMAFGPVMLIWFLTLTALGLRGISHHPEVLAAVSPAYAFEFFANNGWTGFLILGAVFLVIPGGEALYADMGHFGRLPIRLTWFSVAMPALILNYFGQGAWILSNPKGVTSPFYHLAPNWAIYPLVLLATLATVIASQALISGAFSLTRQAVQLGMCPRLRIVQTSPEAIGQIYVPFVNWMLMILTLALVLGFGSSSKLAGAYGVAITSVMVITTVLAFYVMRRRWGWSRISALALAGFFLIFDLAFLGSSLFKIPQGGWVPLLVAGIVLTLLSTWRKGRALLEYRLKDTTSTLDDFLDRIARNPPMRASGTAVFMTGRRLGTPPMLLHHLEHNQVLHEQALLLTVVTHDVPRVPAAERLQVSPLKHGIYRVFVYVGFLQSPNVPVALRECERFGLKVDLDQTTYYLGWETLIPSPGVHGMAVWREALFAFMTRNAARATAYYSIPPERVVEIGIHVEL